MKKGLFFSIILISGCILFSTCNRAPVYPDTPEISFNSVEKYPAGDSLVITINFKDGDGDLGLEADFNSSPYNEYNYLKDGTGNYIKFGSDPSLPPYSCKKYHIGEFFTPSDPDTLRADYNINYHNYHLEIFVKQMDGTYLKFDDSDFCYFSQRFPPLSEANDKGPIEGTLTHIVKSGLFFQFAGQTIKLKIFIIDRALHQSNVIETPDIEMN